MLVLTRKPGESIVIDGRITVKIVRVEGDTVKVGITAPADVPIHREELYLEIQQSNQAALTRGRAPVPKLAPSPDPLCPPAKPRLVTVSPVEVRNQP
ncbi:MAG: carbon storage regulator [Limisphaerales bacterium]|nr:MAG: carbon storage regulator [Limisphaerales bacterium]KAG0507123.1 MAG: carbon storage regulator [Limisphaerales bacterium]TXT49327.1 MAG: carbon storage regulator [Limisphaerales bacterium]